MIRDVASTVDIRTAKPFEPVVRERLLDRLAHAASFRVVVVAAPAGFGKSVALRHYLDRAYAGALRCTLRREHGTLLEFLRAMADVLEPIAPTMTASLAAVYANAEHSRTVVADVATWLAAALADYVGAIAIDDVHHAAADPRVMQVLVELVDRTSESVRWFFATRDPLALPIATWFAYGTADMPIDEVDLRFTQAEAAAAARACDVALKDDALGPILDLTEGWPTAFAFALRVSTRTDELARVARGTREMVYAFLAEQVYRGLTDDDRTFLLRTAMLPVLDLDLLRRSGLADAQAAVARLRRVTAFISEESENVFRYHDLFRDFLERELRRDDVLFAAVCAETAALLERAGEVCEALKLYVEIGSHEAVLRTIELRGAELYDRAQVRALEEAVRSLPRSFIDRSPLALTFAAMVEGLQGNFDRADSLYSRALQVGSDAKALAFVAMRRAMSFLHRIDAVSAIAALANVDVDSVAADGLRARILAIKAYALALTSESSALSVAQSALKVVELVEDTATETTVLQYVAFVEHRNGKFIEARNHAQRVVDIAEGEGLFGLAARAGSLLYAIAYDLGDQEGSLRQLARLQHNADRIGDRMMIAYATMSAYELYVDRGDLERINELECVLGADGSKAAMETASSALLPALAMQHAWAGNFSVAGAMLSEASHANAPDRTAREAARVAEVALYAAGAGARDVAEHELRIFTELLESLEEDSASGTPRAMRARLIAAMASLLVSRSATANKLLSDVEADAAGATVAIRALARAVRAAYVHVETGAGHEDFRASLAALSAVGYGGFARMLEALPLPRTSEKRNFSALTPMEVRVLTKLSKGATSRELAAEFQRSSLTIDSHVKSIVRKLNCHGRREAVALARKHGILA